MILKRYRGLDKETIEAENYRKGVIIEALCAQRDRLILAGRFITPEEKKTLEILDTEIRANSLFSV